MPLQILAWINHSVSFIFATDLVLNFFRPFRDALSQKVKDHRKIAIAYLRSWFIIDLMSTIPIDLIVGLMTNGAGGSKLLTDLRSSGRGAQPRLAPHAN